MLLELLDERDAPVLTGAVESGGGPGPVTVHLGASPPLPAERCEVIASFFTTGALYLARGTARQLAERWLVELDVRELQTVQRRGAPRVPRRYPVAVGAFSGLDDYVSVAGETVDLAPGGCRVLVDQPLPEATEATVCIRLSEDSVMAHARVLENRADGGRWEYRLAFDQIEAPDRRRLATLLRER